MLGLSSCGSTPHRPKLGLTDFTKVHGEGSLGAVREMGERVVRSPSDGELLGHACRRSAPATFFELFTLDGIRRHKDGDAQAGNVLVLADQWPLIQT
jgi:hypothetical protein